MAHSLLIDGNTIKVVDTQSTSYINDRLARYMMSNTDASPSWFTGGINIKEFLSSYQNDPQLSVILNYELVTKINTEFEDIVVIDFDYQFEAETGKIIISLTYFINENEQFNALILEL